MKSKLILLRHGQSVWNKKNLFTGWVDIPLSEEGVKESFRAGERIKNFPIDVVFTSKLIRSQMTAGLALMNHPSGKVPLFIHEEKDLMGKWSRSYGETASMIPVYSAVQLNERAYGKLQGLNKAETAEKFGIDQVQKWRRSFDTVPPEGESLEMTVKRALPFFLDRIVSALEEKKNVLVVAHGNSLRGIMMHLDGLSKEEVVRLEIATGEVVVYNYNKGQWGKETSI